MSNAFLSYGGDDLSSLQNGAVEVNLAAITDQSLVPNLPVRAGNNKRLVSGLIGLSDISFTPLTSPILGDLVVNGSLIADNVVSAGLSLNEFVQVSTNKIIDLENATNNITLSNGVTTISGTLSATDIRANTIVDATTASELISLDADGVDVLASSFTYNGDDVATDASVAAAIAALPTPPVTTLTSSGGVPLVSDGTGPTLAIKGLVSGANITIAASATAVTISATNQQITTLQSAGGITSLVANGIGPGLLTKGLNAGSGINIASDPSSISIQVDSATLARISDIEASAVRNPMQADLSGGNNGIVDVAFIEAQTLILLASNSASLDVSGGFIQRRNGTNLFYQTNYDKPGGVLNNDIFYRTSHNTNLGNVVAVVMRAIGDQSGSNRGSEYTIETCLQNEINRIERLRIGADNTTYVTGGLNVSGPLSMSSQRVTSLATPIANDDAANKSYVDTAVATLIVYKFSRTPTGVDRLVLVNALYSDELMEVGWVSASTDVQWVLKAMPPATGVGGYIAVVLYRVSNSFSVTRSVQQFNQIELWSGPNGRLTNVGDIIDVTVYPQTDPGFQAPRYHIKIVRGSADILMTVERFNPP